MRRKSPCSYSEFRNSSEAEMMQSHGSSEAECSLWACHGKGQVSVSLGFELQFFFASSLHGATPLSLDLAVVLGHFAFLLSHPI